MADDKTEIGPGPAPGTCSVMKNENREASPTEIAPRSNDTGSDDTGETEIRPPDANRPAAAMGAERAQPRPATPWDFELLGLNHSVAGQTFSLNKTHMAIGRSPFNDITLNEASVSTYHARMRQEGGQWILADTHSLNGIRINGKEVQEQALANGDVVSFGEVQLMFAEPGTAATRQRQLNRKISIRKAAMVVAVVFLLTTLMLAVSGGMLE